MPATTGKLSRKIFGILVIFFAVAAAAIGLTLAISWQLEGVAAAINDAGSQRMRTYRIGHLMARGTAPGAAAADHFANVGEELVRFDKVLHDLQAGDPARPLAAPRNGEVQQRLAEVEQAWRQAVRPLIDQYRQVPAAGRIALVEQFDRELEPFVSRINELVLAMERSYTDDTNLLRSVQAALILMALLGTAILSQFFARQVIRPVGVLHAGMQQMRDNDLTVRLPVNGDDELGALADGFNQMAAHLARVYATLEERVEAETRRLAERNHELSILYAVTAFLGEPAPLAALCDGFLERIVSALGADAGAVQLAAPGADRLAMLSSLGLSAEFIAQAESRTAALAVDEVRPPTVPFREGFATAMAFNIVYDKQPLGVYILYFRRPQVLSTPEVHLLETLGYHLGVACENQRLKSREKELAVSEERNLLAQDLHDSIAQGLAFLNLQIQLLQDSLRKGNTEEAMHTAGQLREGVQESYDHVRELLVHFRTRVLQSDLDSAIEAALAKFAGQTGIHTEFQRQGSGTPFAQADEVQIMHIIQESLSNIRKHAQASEVRVTVRRDAMACQIEIEDDGVGFDPQTEPNCHSERHVGLQIMRERAQRVGGECQITSRPGFGACVTLSLTRPSRESE